MEVVSYVKRIREADPLIHCITNPVTINDCANILLAIGASPTMAYHEEETAEITSHAKALVLNMGLTTSHTAMVSAGKEANRRGIPVVLDPVGVGASSLRQQQFLHLTEQVSLAAIRGNASEIRTLERITQETNSATPEETPAQELGVDVASADRLTEETVRTWAPVAERLAGRLHCVVIISGPADLVSDGSQTRLLPGGSDLMSRITGSGCMLTSLLGAFLGVDPTHPLDAAAAAVSAMNTSAERAAEQTTAAGGGTMTFRLHLIDAISLM